jgi:hypothetical protein
MGVSEERTSACKAKVSPLLEAFAKELLVKTWGQGLAGAVVICELWRLAVAVYLLVIQNRVYKRLLSPFIKPDPIKSYSFT